MEQDSTQTEKKVFDDGTRREVHFTLTNVTTTEHGKKVLDNPYQIPAYPLEERTFKEILIDNGTFIFINAVKFIVGLLYIYSIALVGEKFGGIAALIYIPISFWLLFSTYEYFFTDRRIW